jgi:hypothetical protein
MAAAGLLMGAVLLLARDWPSAFEPLGSLGRGMVIGALGTILAVYPAVPPAAVLGLAIAAWAVRWAGRPRGPRPARSAAMRWLLVCGSTLLGLGLAEAAASAWLAWIHRLPAWTARWAASPRPTADVSIVVIGGSSALGVPYEGWISVGEIVGRELGRAIPGRRFRVEVLAEKGATLEAMHLKLARLTHRPDVLIIYSGHNEFVTRFSWLHRASYYPDELESGRHWAALWRLGRGSPLFRLVQENLEKQRVGLIPTRALGPRETLVGRPVCSHEETAAIVADFRRRLGAIVAGCERIGCLPVLIIPPGNEAWDPNQSYADAATRRDEREALFRRMTVIRAAEAADAAGAIAAYRAVVAGQPTLAEAHYRLARLLDAAGSSAPARRHYRLARDHDGLPMRCTTPLEDAYRLVAAQAPGAVLIDGPAVLAARAPRGILAAGLFHDNVHPTLAVHVALAEAVLGRLKSRSAFGWPSSVPAPALDPRRVAAEFGLDAAAWARVCERTAAQLNLLAWVPFDPTERVVLRDRYRSAADRIRAGIPPEDVGLPGIGVGPPDSGMVAAQETSE